MGCGNCHWNGKTTWLVNCRQTENGEGFIHNFHNKGKKTCYSHFAIPRICDHVHFTQIFRDECNNVMCVGGCLWLSCIEESKHAWLQQHVNLWLVVWRDTDWNSAPRKTSHISSHVFGSLETSKCMGPLYRLLQVCCETEMSSHSKQRPETARQVGRTKENKLPLELNKHMTLQFCHCSKLKTLCSVEMGIDWDPRVTKNERFQ